MSAEEVQGRFKVKRCDYYTVLAEELLDFVDDKGGEDVGIQVNLPSTDLHGHNPIPAPHKERMRCAICKLEEKWMKVCQVKGDYGKGSRQQRHLAVCELCGISAHSLPVPWHRKIFGLEQMKCLSCFQIAYSEHCVGAWIGRKGDNNMATRKGKVIKKHSYSVSNVHPVYRDLMRMYRINSRIRKRKRVRGENIDDDSFEVEDTEFDEKL
jgi:hypothetical protein